MTQYNVVLDDSTGKIGLKPIASGVNWVEDYFDVTAPEGQSTFELTQTISAASKIEAFINDRSKFEDRTSPTVVRDWTRDTVLDEITFNQTVQQGAKVTIRIWL